MQANSNITSHTKKRRGEIRAKRILAMRDTTNTVAKEKPEKIQPSAVAFGRREVTTSQKLNLYNYGIGWHTVKFQK